MLIKRLVAERPQYFALLAFVIVGINAFAGIQKNVHRKTILLYKFFVCFFVRGFHPKSGDQRQQVPILIGARIDINVPAGYPHCIADPPQFCAL